MHCFKNLIYGVCIIVLLAGCKNQTASFVSNEESVTTPYESGEEQTTASYESGEEQMTTSMEQVETQMTTFVEQNPQEETMSDNLVAVYVCGAVKNPGVYYLEASDLKNTAIQLAGGFSEDAETAYVNLAQKVSDGERIYVPTKAELEEGNVYDTFDEATTELMQTQELKEQKININTAGKETLMTLPGIGESKAEAILEYRQEKGGFRSADELMNIPGIKEGVYNKIKHVIVVN